MFRPQGLSTVTYDWPSFYPTGKYWNGAVWAPSSFQYIKGLEYYGYRELAFGEALRHLEALSDVYQAGKTDSVIGSATFWENYSSEYTRQGDPARSNFVGWTGALAIGVIIEDILGIDLNAPGKHGELGSPFDRGKWYQQSVYVPRRAARPRFPLHGGAHRVGIPGGYHRYSD